MKRMIMLLSAVLLITVVFPTNTSAADYGGKGAGASNGIVYAAGTTSYAVGSDGTLWGWGYPLAVNHGIGDHQDIKPLKMMDGVASVSTQINYNQTILQLAVKTNGDLVEVITGKVFARDVVSAVASGSDLLIIKKDNSLYQSKVNAASPSFTKVMDNVAGICAEPGNNYALKTDGTLWGWGGAHISRQRRASDQNQ